jgi:hypothetical protein
MIKILFKYVVKKLTYIAGSYNTLIGLTKLYQNEGIFRLWIGPFNPVIVLLSPENIEVIKL